MATGEVLFPCVDIRIHFQKNKQVFPDHITVTRVVMIDKGTYYEMLHCSHLNHIYPVRKTHNGDCRLTTWHSLKFPGSRLSPKLPYLITDYLNQ